MMMLEIIRKFFENKKGKVSEGHWLLLNMFADGLIFENQPPVRTSIR